MLNFGFNLQAIPSCIFTTYMKKFTFILLSAFMVFSMATTSCSKEKQLEKRLAGDWALEKWDATISDPGTGQSQTFNFTNAGTMTFKEGGTGTYSLVAAGTTQNGNFNWVNTATTVTITESGEPVKIYTVTTNEKERQVWTTTYVEQGANVSETLTMTLK